MAVKKEAGIRAKSDGRVDGGRERGVYAKCKRNSRADLPPQPERERE